jgi:uncharacterized protein
MELFDRINADLKEAMKRKDQGALRAIRAIKAALLLLKTEEKNKEITEDDEIKLLKRLVKQRKESIEIYQKQNRMDLLTEEKEELSVLEKYLPEALDADTIESVLKKIIHETGAGSLADMGKVMAIAMKELGGKADGKIVSEKVKELLS